MSSELEHLLGKEAGKTIDLEALEQAMRSRALDVAARVLERHLNQGGEEGFPVLPCSCGKEARPAGTRSKDFLSVLGPLRLERRYYLCPSCKTGVFPKDRTLGVDGASVTPGVLRMVGIVGAELSFEKGGAFLRDLAGLSVSPKQVERVAEALGAEMAEDERTVFDPDPVADLPSTLYLGLDGTGIPMRPEEVADRPGKQPDGSSRTREVKLCVLWSAETTDEEGIPVRDEGSATYSAAIESAASTDTEGESSEFAKRVLRETSCRQFDQVTRQVAVADGAPWIWNMMNEHFPKAIWILDLFHAKEHLGTVGKALFGPESDRIRPWVKERHAELDDGKIDAIITELRIYAPRCEEARKCIGYLETNRSRMRYPEFRAQGLCVSSGMVEAGCKVTVGARLKQSGMHWSLTGSNAIIALRCAKLSGRFEGFFERRAARKCG